RREDPHRRRLAGAVVADEAEHLAAIHAERDVVHGAHVVELPDEAVDLEHRAVHCWAGRAGWPGWPSGQPSTRWKLPRSRTPVTPGSQNGELSSTAMYDPSGCDSRSRRKKTRGA